MTSRALEWISSLKPKGDLRTQSDVRKVIPESTNYLLVTSVSSHLTACIEKNREDVGADDSFLSLHAAFSHIGWIDRGVEDTYSEWLTY